MKQGEKRLCRIYGYFVKERTLNTVATMFVPNRLQIAVRARKESVIMTQSISLDQNYWENQGIEQIQCPHWYKEGHWIVCINPEEAVVGWLLKIFWDNGSEELYRVTAVHDLWIVEVEKV